jgi:hypothetical protein
MSGSTLTIRGTRDRFLQAQRDMEGTATAQWIASLADHIKAARHWVCECGARADGCSSDWRWNGQQWEHYHGYPIGHVRAAYSPLPAA